VTLDQEITLCVCTYNSSSTLEHCLTSLRGSLANARLIVIDHMSADNTVTIALKHNAEVYKEDVGLGWARQLCIDKVATPYFAFVDSDVELVDRGFFRKAVRILEDRRVGAVVGMSRGHIFAFGLPASLLVLRKTDFQGQIIPKWIDARETFYIQRRLDELGLKTVYIKDAMIHRSQFRRYKPEWEGANTRLLDSDVLKELLFSLGVIILISLNSKNVKNIAYIPFFYLKFLRGFAQPEKWAKLTRRVGGELN
jgi:glycosyltransferase involved in cell wall biosynthesis